jgi:hypothetical protein
MQKIDLWCKGTKKLANMQKNLPKICIIQKKYLPLRQIS